MESHRSRLLSLGKHTLRAAAILGASLLAAADGGGPTRVRWTGGTQDDQALAVAAAGLTEGRFLPKGNLETALTAIRLTDRFRRVEAHAEGDVIGILLEPWPVLETWEWVGDLPKELRKDFLPELRKGIHLGELRRERWRSAAQNYLRETGYPKAEVSLETRDGGRGLLIRVALGEAALVRRLAFTGNLEPYDAKRLEKLSGVQPGKTLWHAGTSREILARLRSRFQKDHRYEWRAELDYHEGDGTLSFKVDPGPQVQIRILGSGIPWTSREADLVPLTRADSYSPALLDEGERRILRLLRGRGYLDAQVSHVRELLPGPEPKVRLTYRIASGPRYRLNGVRCERNQEISSTRIQAELDIPHRWVFMGRPMVTPELMGYLEDKIKSLYIAEGYTDVSIRRPPMEHQGEEATLLFQIREGRARRLRRINLSLPPGLMAQGDALAELLSAAFSDQVLRQPGPGKVYRSDRPSLKGVTAALSGSGTSYSLAFSRPIPLVKRDLAQVISLLHQRQVTLGIQRPLEQMRLDEAEGAITIELAPQVGEQVQRLVVQGADQTRAEAILREVRLSPGTPLDPDRLAQGQSGVANLGAFQRVDMSSLANAEGPPPAPAWKPGDLLLGVHERSPWVISNSFGYDRAQGYHFGTGVQRLNVGGMGRTMDFGLRAGDGTIHNPGMRRLFPTGDSPRSVDKYSLGYTDPWFAPGFLQGWIPERTQLRAEAAYISERRDAYLIRRRQLTFSLEWRRGSHLVYSIGHRLEGVNVSAEDVGSGYATLSDAELNLITHSPSRSTISAPYFQVVRDTRDNPFDPIRGQYSLARAELATQFLGTTPNSSFIKLDLRHQWTWPVGARAWAGVACLGLRVGMARPTARSADDLPLSERFFGGGPFSQRGVQADWLGPRALVPMTTASGATVNEWVALGGQGLALVNAEYRFPVLSPTLWGEVFVDSGQVYSKLNDSTHQPFRTAVGVGAILKVGFPIKIEYAVDFKRLRGQPLTDEEKATQYRNLLISAGFQW